ncbi:MAG: glycosyltransferase family 9 protein [Candidatus Goldbacteria bacterium]|nr:glycosyltransferase family 9 protein [Candidatus Goldiibacteriota bacterium]
MLKNVNRILIIKLRDIGDIVLSTPVIQAVYDNCNSPKIVYVLKKEYENFKFLLPNVSEVLTYDKKSFLSFIKLIFKLRKYKFDIAVNLHATFRSALITRLSGAKLRLVHNHSGRDYFTSVPLGIEEKAKPITIRDMETLTPLDIKTPSAGSIKTKLILKEKDIKYIDETLPPDTIGFGVGAKRPAKMWKKENFIELGRKLSSENKHIAVFAASSERALAGEITAAIGGGASLYCGLDFLKLAFLLKQLRAFAGNDSGLRHMAAALGVATVTFFGPEDPVEWHPYLEKDGHIALMHRLECINCAKNDCPKGTRECMDLITVDEAFKAINKAIKTRG